MNTDNMKFEKKLVKIDSLVTENLQIRLEMVEDTIEHYAAIYRDDPGKLPPVTVFYNVMLDEYYLADGFHRLAARKRNGSDTILAEIHEGDKDDALRFAIKANAENALQRTKADMIHAMELVLEKWDTLYANEPRTTANGYPSARQLAKLTGVSKSKCATFLHIKGVSTVDTPRQENKSDGIVVPEICDDVPNALTVTKDHLEERNPEVRALLKEHKDRFGVPIPDSLWSAFLSREPQEMLKELRGLRKKIETHHLNGNKAFANSARFAMTHFNNLIRTIDSGTVYCVCPICRGAACSKCFGHGFMTHDQHKQYLKEKEAGEL